MMTTAPTNGQHVVTKLCDRCAAADTRHASGFCATCRASMAERFKADLARRRKEIERGSLAASLAVEPVAGFEAVKVEPPF
jgi:hypothetical protein